jgi:hypothetical protein
LGFWANLVGLGWRRIRGADAGIAAHPPTLERVVSPISIGLAGRFFDRPVG